jgi:hypothetical protein
MIKFNQLTPLISWRHMATGTSEFEPNEKEVPFFDPKTDPSPEISATFLKLMSENGGRWAKLHEEVSALGNDGKLCFAYLTNEINFSETSVDYEISYKAFANKVKAFKKFYSLD